MKDKLITEDEVKAIMEAVDLDGIVACEKHNMRFERLTGNQWKMIIFTDIPPTKDTHKVEYSLYE